MINYPSGIKKKVKTNCRYVFDLPRKANKSLKDGNLMLSSNDRMHHMVESTIKKHLRVLGKMKALADKPSYTFTPDKPCVVKVTVCPPTNRLMDPPNWYPTVKALIDGFTDAGVWSDDNYTVIKEMSFRHGPKTDTGEYRIVIDIDPV